MFRLRIQIGGRSTPVLPLIVVLGILLMLVLSARAEDWPAWLHRGRRLQCRPWRWVGDRDHQAVGYVGLFIFSLCVKFR